MWAFPRFDISILWVNIGHIAKTVSIWNWSIDNFFCCKVHKRLAWSRVRLKLAHSTDLFMPRSVVPRKIIHALTFVLDSVQSKLPGILSRAARCARDVSSWQIKVLHLKNSKTSLEHLYLWLFPLLCHNDHLNNVMEASSTRKIDGKTGSSSATRVARHLQVSLENASLVQKAQKFLDNIWSVMKTSLMQGCVMPTSSVRTQHICTMVLYQSSDPLNVICIPSSGIQLSIEWVGFIGLTLTVLRNAISHFKIILSYNLYFIYWNITTFEDFYSNKL